MKKLVLLAAVLVLLVPMAVFADSVTFNNVNNLTSTTWSYSGGAAPFSLNLADNASNHQGNYQVNGGSNTPIDNLKLTLTTGNATSHTASQITFGNAGSTWTISGDYGLLCSGGCVIATGTLSGASVTQLNAGAQPTFTASFLIGTISASWTSFAGMSGLPTVDGNTSATLIGSFTYAGGGTGEVKGASTFLQQTPEPATLSLMSMGLLGLAGAIRRRK